MTDTVTQNPYQSPEGELIPANDERESVAIFSLSQRIGRIRYLAYSSVSNILFMLFALAFGVFEAVANMEYSEQLSPTSIVVLAIYYLVSIFVGVVLAARRLHDLDKSGWLQLLFLIPLVNIGMAIYLVFFPGSEASNRFGGKPEPNGVMTWIAGLLLPIVFVVGIIAAIAIPAYQDYVQRAQAYESGEFQ